MKKRLMVIVTMLMTMEMVMATDKVTIYDFLISPGQTKVIKISLENDEAYAAFQFDLHLPKGITVVPDSHSANAERVPASTNLYMSTLSEGVYRFLSAGMSVDPLVGNSGVIVSLTVKADENLSEGELTGYFRNIVLAKGDATGQKYEEMSFPVTIVNSIPGDANGDGRVSIADASLIVDYILSGGTITISAGADMNGDGKVSIADASAIVDYILSNH